MFKRQPTDTQFIFLTLMLVLLMGIPTFQTLTQKEEVSDVQVAAESPPLTTKRSPSSLPASVVDVKPALQQFTAYDLSCAKKSASELTVSGPYVQFQGRNCLKNFKSGDVEIVNKSNGYTASIFSSGSDKYQTDLIQLQQGENEIAIRYRESSGKPVEVVVRVHSSKI
ncbi:hypothetical protein [Bdellovibrio sp.]|uniref:hypothetical protein n=1 Tax=Bdellovibrio sp. TaxID=28201 RepID=UPI0039E559FD